MVQRKSTMRPESKWDQAKSFLIKDYHMYLGVLSDDKNLYVHLLTTDNGIQQSIATSGCTIWVDAAGGFTKIYGIHYPATKLPEATEQTTRPATPDQQTPQALEIVSNGGDGRTRITINEALALGIEASTISTNRYIIYDLTIPYTEIIAHHGSQMSHLPQSIAIALEIEGVTPVKSEKSETVKPGGKGQRGQGGKGGGGGMRSGGGMRGGDKPQEMERTESNEPKPNESGVKETLEKWFIIDL